jgi:hypothetical protein
MEFVNHDVPNEFHVMELANHDVPNEFHVVPIEFHVMAGELHGLRGRHRDRPIIVSSLWHTRSRRFFAGIAGADVAVFPPR